MKLIAHRGLYKYKSEENTLNSFINAFNSSQYIGIEFDIQETKDNYYIVNHDPIIEGKYIKNTLLKDIKKYTLLEEVLSINTNKIFLIEVKNYEINFIKFNNILNNYSKNIYVMSFHNNILNNLSKLEYKYKLGSLNYILNNIKNYNYDFICLLDNINSKKKIYNFLSNDIEVFIYGITNLNDYINYSDKIYYIR